MNDKLVTLRVHNPAGASELCHPYATRLDSLRGKTIGELWNGLWRGYDTFPLIRNKLRCAYPDLKIIPYTEFPIGIAQIDSDKTADLVVREGCQGVIIGNAC